MLAQLVRVPDAWDAAEAARRLSEERRAPADQLVRYAPDGTRAVRAWEELPWPAGEPAGAARPWRDGGAYLITGGAGGLGALMARQAHAGERPEPERAAYDGEERHSPRLPQWCS